MDADKAELKVQALASLRSLERELDRSEENHRYTEKGQVHQGIPLWHEIYNDALRQLQQAGEDIKDSEIRPAVIHRDRIGKRGPVEEWINASGLRTNIKRVLARVDPPQD